MTTWVDLTTYPEEPTLWLWTFDGDFGYEWSYITEEPEMVLSDLPCGIEYEVIVRTYVGGWSDPSEPTAYNCLPETGLVGLLAGMALLWRLRK